MNTPHDAEWLEYDDDTRPVTKRPADTIREALAAARFDHAPAYHVARAALTELEQRVEHLTEALIREADKVLAAEADRERLQRENKRLTNDLDDLQRANDKMRRENQKLRRGDVVADCDRLQAEREDDDEQIARLEGALDQAHKDYDETKDERDRLADTLREIADADGPHSRLAREAARAALDRHTTQRPAIPCDHGLHWGVCPECQRINALDRHTEEAK